MDTVSVPNTTDEIKKIEDRYMTPREAAEEKGVKVDTIYKAIERGHLTSNKVLGRVVVLASEIAAWAPGSYTRGDIVREGPKKTRGRNGGRPIAAPVVTEEVSGDSRQ